MAEMYLARPRFIPTKRPVKRPPKFEFKVLPKDQWGPTVTFRTEVAEQSKHEQRVQAEEARMDKTLERLSNMILAKNRIRVIGPPLCQDKNCSKKMKKKKCVKKIKSKICPHDLLDRRTYKKFRDGKKKKHGKRGRKHGRKHRHHRRHRHGRRGKHAAGGHDEAMTNMVMEHNMTARGSWERSV